MPRALFYLLQGDDNPKHETLGFRSQSEGLEFGVWRLELRVEVPELRVCFFDFCHLLHPLVVHSSVKNPPKIETPPVYDGTISGALVISW